MMKLAKAPHQAKASVAMSLLSFSNVEMIIQLS